MKQYLFLGDSITVPSIDGKVEYTVPEGTQSGTTFRLRIIFLILPILDTAMSLSLPADRNM